MFGCQMVSPVLRDLIQEQDLIASQVSLDDAFTPRVPMYMVQPAAPVRGSTALRTMPWALCLPEKKHARVREISRWTVRGEVTSGSRVSGVSRIVPRRDVSASDCVRWIFLSIFFFRTPGKPP